MVARPALGPRSGLPQALEQAAGQAPHQAVEFQLQQARLQGGRVEAGAGLLKAARAMGCSVSDGGGMAVGAFELFTGVTPDASRMDAHFRRLVSGL